MTLPVASYPQSSLYFGLTAPYAIYRYADKRHNS
jgi:hypothetical protein